MTINLPRLNQTGANEWSDVEDNDIALKEAIEELQSEVTSAVKPVTWYTPKVIPTEETRTNTAFGTLTTADKISGVVMPENGFITIFYDANFKSSVSTAGQAAIFLGSNQLKYDSGSTTVPVVQSAPTVGTSFAHVTSGPIGLERQASGGAWAGDVTTGQALGWITPTEVWGGPCWVFAAAGTYDISIQFKASSGSVTAKERKLWVATFG